MFNPFEKIYSSDENLYFKTNRFELWAHLSPSQVLVQLRSFFPEGGVKTFAKTLTKISHQNILIDHKIIFQQLSRNPPKNSDAKKGKILLEIKNFKVFKNATTLQIQLDELKNEPSFENWFMLKILKEKTEYLQNKIQENNQILSDSIELEDHQPNINFRHQNEKYRFEAELDLIHREIKTELVVKGIEREGRKREKCFQSAIREKDWGYEYRNQFKNIETLFEHLKNSKNYQVLEDKGLIRIRNQPIPVLDLSKIKNIPGVQTEKTSNKTFTFSQTKRKVRKDSESIEVHRKLLAEKQLMIAREISQLGQKLQNQLHIFMKQSEKQISNHENDEYKRYSGKFKNLEKQVRKQLNSNLKRQIQDIKKQAQRTIMQIVAAYELKISESSANMRKSHFIQARNISQTKAEKIKKIPNFNGQKQEEEKQRITIDESSSQIQYFYVGQDGDIIYRGPWDWTQVFTNSKIGFEGTYELKFRVLKSVYNAIAIGVSSASNKHERSSLTKSESICYWGDGEIWEKMKIKQQGQGFQVGETVLMQVNRNAGEIKWIAGKSTAIYKSKILSDKNLILFAYIQMYDNGDKIQLLTCKIV